MKTSQGREQVGSRAGRPGTGTLAGDEERETITLKNGAVMDARRAVSLHGELDAMLEVTPAVFRSLLALAEGRPNDADPAHINDLREERFLAADNSVVPDVAALLTNCYEVTSEGPVMVPLRLQSKADAAAAGRAEEVIEDRLTKLVRKLRRSGPPRGPSPG
jgi:hypothetical protein